MSNGKVVTQASGDEGWGPRARTVARRLALGGAAASLAAGLVMPGATAQQDEEVVLPDAFAGAASATAVGVHLLTPALLPVEGLFEFAVAEGRGTYDSSNQEARASLLFPGNGAISGPSLACDQIRANVPPEGAPIFGPLLAACAQFRFPLAVFADSLAADRQTEGAFALGDHGDPVSAQATGARAHAALDGTTTDSEVGDLRIAGAPAVGSLDGLLRTLGLEPAEPTAVVADVMTATTDQRIVDDALVVTSRATVEGLRLLGGLVRVGSVVSESAITSRPGEEPEVASSVQLGGVEVAGSPATLTDDGLVLAGSPSGPLAQQLASQVSELLRDAGFRMELLPTEQGEIDGIPFATAGGVLVEFRTPIQGLPPVPGPLGDLDVNGAYGVRLLLGTTGARGYAEQFDSSSAGSPSVGSPSAVGSGAFDGPAGFDAALGGGGAPAPGSAATGSGEVADGGPAVERSGALSDLFADRLGFLYLSFTLTAVALCLAPKLTLPARFPAA